MLLTSIGVSTRNTENGLGLVTADSSNPLNAPSVESQDANLWMGIKMGNISSPMAQILGLNESMGAIVTDVTPGSPAQKAGLRTPEMNINSIGQPQGISKADVILKINNLTVSSTSDIDSVVQSLKSGDKLALDVLQDGEINKVTVTPVPKPDYFVFYDPEGLYSIAYPVTWTVLNPGLVQQMAQQSEELQQLAPPEMIQNLAATFVKPGSGTSITITKNPGAAAGVSDAQMESMADEGFIHMLTQENGTIIKDMECNKYKVEGSKACSYVIGLRSGLPNNVLPNNVMQVLTIAGEKAFVFTYSSLPENFDKDLPVLEKMLQSFNRTGMSG
jgi:hypothetical protein